jgi:hypothetical protein
MVLFDPAGTTWRVDREALVRDVGSGWPQATVDTSVHDEARGLTWEFDDEEGPVEARLHVDGTCVYVDGQLGSAARVAVWFRRLVPPGVDLIFCDTGYNSSSPVVPGMTASELERQM